MGFIKKLWKKQSFSKKFETCVEDEESGTRFIGLFGEL
jgi:hypothetical protein